MNAQIAAALDLNVSFITNVIVEGKTVSFDMNGVGYYAKLVRGQFKMENMRRAP